MNLVLNRIIGQKRDVPPNVPAPTQEPIPERQDPPLSVEELKKFLLDTMPETPPPSPIVSLAVQEDIRFPNIYTFVDWYVPNKEKFSPEQQTALDTLVGMRGLIEQGCACKRAGREYAANDYYQTFWLNNLKTDMMPTLLAALNVKKVFLSEAIEYPAPQNYT